METVAPPGLVAYKWTARHWQRLLFANDTPKNIKNVIEMN